MTGDSSLGFTIFNALTDKSILSGVSVKEASDFFWANDPTHPALSYLEKQDNSAHYNYDYFANYGLELDAWSELDKLYPYHYELNSSNYFHKKGEWDTLEYYKDVDKQLEFNFNKTLKSLDDPAGVCATYTITKENNILDNDYSHEDNLDHLPELDSDD